ncbi:alpha/beta-Hydrolases superfamily protein [Wolffia australiana]
MGRIPLILAMVALLQACAAAKLHPIVLIPGNGGNQLEARLSKDYKPSSFFCRLWGNRRNNGDGWFRLWFDPIILLRPFTQCFADRMALRYVEELDDFRNVAGVETRVPHFGSTRGLRYLDPGFQSISEYMETLVESLEGIGYRDGDNLYGAPYDFRYGLSGGGRPCSVGDRYLADLKQLVENATAAASKPVVLIAHSLGNLFAMNLLLRSSPDWRRRHVKHLVALSPPWGGSVVLMLTFASGSTLGVPVVDPLVLRDEQRSSESNLWLLPSPAVFKDRPLVISPGKNYTAVGMSSFLEDIGYREGVGPYENRVLPLVEREVVAPPEVPVTCVVGTGVKTPERLVYGKEGFDRQPEMVYGDGDGTVNLASLLSLQSSDDGQAVKFVKVNGVSHTDVLKNKAAIAEILREMEAINADQTSLSSQVYQTLSL